MRRATVAAALLVLVAPATADTAERQCFATEAALLGAPG